jgi:radical SAM protein with 4Fe4S-binding SPASM domain
MNFPVLENKNIFIIKADEQFQNPNDDVYLVYAPLSEQLFTASTEEILEIEKYLSHGNHNHSSKNGILNFVNSILSNEIDIRTITDYSVDDINRLTILPTSSCNFNCSYCYSSKGRSDKTLSKEQIKSAVDYFIDLKWTKRRNIYISILGGGEPLLKWELCSFALKYSAQRAEEFGFNLRLGLTTNGSIMHNEIINTIKKYNVDVGVSFEIFEDIQNKERNNYAGISENIIQLTDNGIMPVVKPIITKENIDRIPAMVKELSLRFPLIKEMKIQPIDSAEYFKSPQEIKIFYDKLFTYLFEARELGKTLGIDVYCVMLKFGLQLKDHYCGGEFCLTPGAEISICHRFSSDKEKAFNSLTFGSVNENNMVIIEEEKYKNIMLENSIRNERCTNCFIKFNCSGGCIAQSTIYNKDMFEEVCEFNRRIVKYQLQEKAFAKPKVF